MSASILAWLYYHGSAQVLITQSQVGAIGGTALLVELGERATRTSISNSQFLSTNVESADLLKMTRAHGSWVWIRSTLLMQISGKSVA